MFLKLNWPDLSYSTLPEKSVKTVLRWDRPSENSLTCWVRANISSWSTGPALAFWLLLRFVKDMLLVIFCCDGLWWDGLSVAPTGTTPFCGPCSIQTVTYNKHLGKKIHSLNLKLDTLIYTKSTFWKKSLHAHYSPNYHSELIHNHTCSMQYIFFLTSLYEG